MAIGDPTAAAAYREALERARRRSAAPTAGAAGPRRGDGRRPRDGRARRSRVWSPTAGRTTARSSSPRATWPSSGPTSSAAWSIAETAQSRVLAGDKNWQVLDLVALQGLLAHNRGEWFDRMRVELRRTRDTPEIANAVFDGYLCPAEYLLYGPTPYAEVIDIAERLRATAQRSGALRAVAFATALIGEAALLSGDLDVAAAELQEAVDLHHDLGSARRRGALAPTPGRGPPRPGRPGRGDPAAPAGPAAGAVVDDRARTCCSASTAR